MKKNMSLAYLVSMSVVLVLSCISCSHTRPGGIEGGLSAEAASPQEGSGNVEGSTEQSAQSDVSEDSASKAAAILDGDNKGTLEATASPEEKKDSIGELSSSQPELLTTPVSSGEATPPSSDITAAASVVAPVSGEATTDSLAKPKNPTRKSSRKISSVAPTPNKKADVFSPGKDSQPPTSQVEGGYFKNPDKGSKVSSVGEEVDDVLGHEAIPEPEKVGEGKGEPALASVEVSSFVERHIFLVTLGVVGFVFGLFIIMRRNRNKEDVGL